VAFSGCGESERDSTPTKKDGSESLEFEPEDIDKPESASQLVEIYSDGGVSEAQVTGCLSHVTVADVCEQDTGGKVAAVEQATEETGEDPCE